MLHIFLSEILNFDSRETGHDKNSHLIKLKDWKRIEVIKDYRFYIICANMLAMPWIATGTFVYQSFIFLLKIGVHLL